MKGKLISILVAVALSSGAAFAADAGGASGTGSGASGTGTGSTTGGAMGTGATGAGMAVPRGGEKAGPEGQQNSLEQFDQNRDGYLSREEAAKIPGLSDQWSRLDTDSNGRLDPAEFGHFNAGPMTKGRLP